MRKHIVLTTIDSVGVSENDVLVTDHSIVLTIEDIVVIHNSRVIGYLLKEVVSQIDIVIVVVGVFEGEPGIVVEVSFKNVTGYLKLVESHWVYRYFRNVDQGRGHQLDPHDSSNQDDDRFHFVLEQ